MAQNFELNALEELTVNLNSDEANSQYAKVSNSFINFVSLKERELENYLTNYNKYKNDLVHLVDEHEKEIEIISQRVNWKNPLKIFQNLYNEYLKYSETKSFEKNKAKIDVDFYQQNKPFITKAADQFARILSNSKELGGDAQLKKLVKETTKSLPFLKQKNPKNGLNISTKEAKNLSEIKKYVMSRFESFGLIDNGEIMSIDRESEKKILNDIKIMAINLPKAQTEEVRRNITTYKTLLTEAFEDENLAETIEQTIEILEKAAKQHKKIDKALLSPTTQNMPDLNQLIEPLFQARKDLKELSDKRLSEITPKTKHWAELNYSRNSKNCAAALSL